MKTNNPDPVVATVSLLLIVVLCTLVGVGAAAGISRVIFIPKFAQILSGTLVGIFGMYVFIGRMAKNGGVEDE